MNQPVASLTAIDLSVMIGFIAVLGVDQEIWSIGIQIEGRTASQAALTRFENVFKPAVNDLQPASLKTEDTSPTRRKPAGERITGCG